MAPPPSLLGPPELSKPTTQTPPPPSQPGSDSDPKPATGEPFVDLMVSNFNDIAMGNRPPMGLTENMSATYLSTGDPCLDLFFHVVPDTPAEYLNQQLPIAWAHNPLTTLKLICNLRGVRGTGKSDKENFHTAAFWLHNHHPKTLACNLKSFVDFGYFKDLPEFLYRLVEGEDVRRNQREEWNNRGEKKRQRSGQDTLLESAPFKKIGSKAEKKSSGAVTAEMSKEEKEAKAREWIKSEKEKASRLRKEKKIATAKKAVARYETDPDYRFLHERVSDVFAEFLKADMENLKAKQNNKISLAAKWCPSIDSSFDRATLICESVARKVFPHESEYEGMEEAHYAYRVRDRLRKEVLVPLRKVLEFPEVYIGANKWGDIPYNRVASVAMKNYKEFFYKHDEERFKKYMEDVKAGKAKIAAGALLPHEIIGSLQEGEVGQVAELQWKRMVEDMLKLGKMKNCLAVCDVSGSMSGTPMEVAVSLGLLVSELSEEPWKGLVITFSENPQLHLVKGDDLMTKCHFVRQMDWGMNTDFQKVFDLLLQVAVKGNLKPENMIKRIFVFSDMEFDQASANSWETDYDVIVNKFKENGYGDAIPQLVFWNLRHSRSTPVPGNQPGVALLGGFSKNLLKLFMDNDGEVRPDVFMELAISGDEYQKLVVHD